MDPGPSRWQFDLSAAPAGEDFLGLGADLEPATVLAAYRAGVFPMPVTGLRRSRLGTSLGWWSPDPRGVLLPGGVHASRSLRKSLRRFEMRVDTAFRQVVEACADPSREGRWITEEIVDAYTELHVLGWAHSIETWLDGELVGGLYGVNIGGLFAGESMFHRVTDASKAAVVAMAGYAFADGDPRRLIDVQWATEHLASLGVVTIPREEYLERLAVAVELAPPAFAAGG